MSYLRRPRVNDVTLDDYFEQDEEQYSPGEYDLEDGFAVADYVPLEYEERHPVSRSKRSRKTHGQELARWHLTKDGVSGTDEEVAAMRLLFKQHAKHWCFQYERGDIQGHLHLQARISLKQRKNKSQVIMDFPGFYPTIESTKGGDTGLGSLYAMKEDTRVKGPWSDRDIEVYKDPMYDIGSHYRSWQKDALDRLATQLTPEGIRKILMVIDADGDSGKTVLAHHIVQYKGGCFVPPFCQNADEIMQFVFGLVKSGGQYIIVIDLPRAALLPKVAPRIFGAIETIKSGYCYDKRYCAKFKYIKPPQVIVFCNSVPDLALLTGDRWDIQTLPRKILQPIPMGPRQVRTEANDPFEDIDDETWQEAQRRADEVFMHDEAQFFQLEQESPAPGHSPQ